MRGIPGLAAHGLRSALVFLMAANPGSWSAVSAQERTPSLIDTIPVPDPWDGRSLLEVRSGGGTVGLAVLFPAGAQDDAVGGEGAAWIRGDALRRTVMERLARVPAQVRVEVDHASTTLTVLAGSESGSLILRETLATLYDSTLPFEQLNAALLAHRGGLRFESGAPVREFERERLSGLLGSDHPWARPLRGTRESVGALDPQTLVDLPRFDPDSARIVVVGDLEVAAVEALLAERGRVPASVEGSQEPEAGDRDTALTELAWSAPARLQIVREITSTWMAIGAPLPKSATALERALLAHHLNGLLTATPPDPDLVSARVEILDPPGGSVLVVTVAVLPRSAAVWERRIRGMFTLERGMPADPSVFAWQRRRLRTALLLERAATDRAATIHARELWRTGRPDDGARMVSTLTREHLVRAGESLGELRVLVFGPDLRGH